MTKSTAPIEVWKFSQGETQKVEDLLAVEEPLEIHLAFGPSNERQAKSISITMRTPGQDFSLAIGFLFTEGIIQSIDQIQDIRYQTLSMDNIVLVEMEATVVIDFKKLERHFYTTSSCGVCGKASIDALQLNHQPQLIAGLPRVSATLIPQLPLLLREQQSVFDHTGGIHAAALFNAKGELLLLHEDVGRHNAVDKLIGAALQQKAFPFQQSIIVVSGRVSFELVQKSLMANIPIMVAVGAPSSLAIQLAREWGMTIIGFTRNNRFNVYCNKERVGKLD
ncbi:MAG: formate dehydrogenase accessory sulfurtransferase FdhD [Bacteroidota bacterium]